MKVCESDFAGLIPKEKRALSAYCFSRQWQMLPYATTTAIKSTVRTFFLRR